jgi:hypothetical protein
LRPAGIAAALAGVIIAVLLVSGVLGGGGDGGGTDAKPAFQTFPAGGKAFELDVRGDDVVFALPATGEDSTIQRLDLSTGRPEQVGSPAPKYSGLDVGLDRANKAQLVYSRCDSDGTACHIYRNAFSGGEREIPASTGECEERRPSMWKGLVLFGRSGAGCASELLLMPLSGGPAEKLTGATGGADLNDGSAVWVARGALTAVEVSPTGDRGSTSTLKPAEGDTFDPPLTVEGDYVYFVHEQGAFFIARARLPLDGSEIEHYVARKGDPGSEVSPPFGFTVDTLYYTNYPQPDGKPGSGVIVRVPNPTFEPVP